MDGHSTEPPEKHQSNYNAIQNESICFEIEVKEEPIVKQELENEDSIFTVSRPSHTASVVTLNGLIGNEQMNNTSDIVDFCRLSEVKSEAKIEKINEEANHLPEKSTDEDKILQKDEKKHFPKRKKQKTNGKNGSANGKVSESDEKDRLNVYDDRNKSFVGRINGKRHECSLCNFATDFDSHLNRHMLKHTGGRPFPCTVCTKRFTAKQYLQSHMKVHVDEFLFNCSICLQGFVYNEGKVEHESGCSVRRYECHLCKEFSTMIKTNLVGHMRVHTGEKPFQCDHCSMEFVRAHDLKRHSKTHTNPRPLKFKCSVCFKTFTQQMEMGNHEANCKRRGYKCDVCKIYTTHYKTHLVNHIRIHSGEKPFRCEICSKCFTQKIGLNIHKKSHKCDDAESKERCH